VKGAQAFAHERASHISRFDPARIANRVILAPPPYRDAPNEKRSRHPTGDISDLSYEVTFRVFFRQQSSIIVARDSDTTSAQGCFLTGNERRFL
jgi:hypothetical protein